MKKLNFVRKCSRKSRLKMAHLAKIRQATSFCPIIYSQNDDGGDTSEVKMLQASLKEMKVEVSAFSKCCSVYSKPRVIMLVSDTEMKQLRHWGFKVQVLEPVIVEGNQHARIIKVVKGLTGGTSTRKKALFERKVRHARISRLYHHRSRIQASGDGGGSFGKFDGGFCPPFGGGGGDDPFDYEEEEKFLISILVTNEETRQKLLEALKLLDKRDNIVLMRLNRIPHKHDGVVSIHKSLPKKLFHEKIEEDKMAVALFDVYEKMLGNSAMRKGVHYDFKPVELIAYLFMVVALCHYGRYEFEKNGKKPFFDFFIKKVRVELYGKHGVTRRTMTNHVNALAGWLFLTDEEKSRKPKPVQNSNKYIEKNYKTVSGIFHNTKYGKWLEEQVWK